MGIINQAHGEFIMLGAYAFTICATHKVPFLLSIVIAVAFVALFGLVVDRLIICRLYDRPLDSIVATWGISLLMTQGMRLLFGPNMKSVSTPLGSLTFGGNRYAVYHFVLAAVAIILLALFYWFFMHTKFGVESRATMQKADIANSLGVNTNKTYSITFMIGSGLAGLTGALYAPLMSVAPGMGQSFIIQSFATVIVGGANPLVGTVLAGASLGLVNGVLALELGQFFGRIGLLVAAILCIRLFPTGFSGIIEKRALRRKANAK